MNKQDIIISEKYPREFLNECNYVNTKKLNQ
jgi:hypothetical protein